MKPIIFLATIVMVGTLTLATAAEVTQPSQVDVDAQIAAIQQADPQERVELMNSFKEQLMQLNEEQRGEAIAKMRSEMQHHQNEQGGKHSGEAMQHQTKEQMQEMQMHANEQTHGMQHMNQQQMGSRFGHQMEQSGGDVHPPMQGGQGGVQEFDMNGMNGRSGMGERR